MADHEETLVVPGVVGLGAVAGSAGPGPQATGLAATAVIPGAGPDEAERDGTVRRRSGRDDEREPGDPAGPSTILHEDDAAWGGRRPADDDHVPVVRPDDETDDMSGWDDVSDADWLTGGPAGQDTEG